jgi:hypothetical protein
MDFWVMIFECEGLDMRVRWIFEGVRTKSDGTVGAQRVLES